MGPHLGPKLISWMIRFGQRTTAETVKRIMGREGPSQSKTVGFPGFDFLDPRLYN